MSFDWSDLPPADLRVALKERLHEMVALRRNLHRKYLLGMLHLGDIQKEYERANHAEDMLRDELEKMDGGIHEAKERPTGRPQAG